MTASAPWRKSTGEERGCPLEPPTTTTTPHTHTHAPPHPPTCCRKASRLPLRLCCRPALAGPQRACHPRPGPPTPAPSSPQCGYRPCSSGVRQWLLPGFLAAQPAWLRWAAVVPHCFCACLAKSVPRPLFPFLFHVPVSSCSPAPLFAQPSFRVPCPRSSLTALCNDMLGWTMQQARVPCDAMECPG